MYAHRWLFACPECGHKKFATDGERKKIHRNQAGSTCTECEAGPKLEQVVGDKIEVQKAIDNYDDLVEAMEEEDCTVALVDGSMWSGEDNENLPLVLVSGPDTKFLQRVTDAPGHVSGQFSADVESPDDEPYAHNLLEQCHATLQDKSLSFEQWLTEHIMKTMAEWDLDSTAQNQWDEVVGQLGFDFLESLGFDTEDRKSDEHQFVMAASSAFVVFLFEQVPLALAKFTQEQVVEGPIGTGDSIALAIKAKYEETH